MEYPWYEIVPEGGDIEQGDLITDCPIVKPPSKITQDVDQQMVYSLIDVTILSQSCDLAHGKIEIVLVCPYYTLKDYFVGLDAKADSKEKKKKIADDLRKGINPGYHLLNKCEIEDNKIDDYIVVDFRNVFGIQIDVLKQVAKERTQRIRLQPPYREHLSQAFARYFMRVGLPNDIIIDKNYFD